MECEINDKMETANFVFEIFSRLELHLQSPVKQSIKRPSPAYPFP